MNLDRQGIANPEPWKERGYQLPSYDIGQMVKNTLENPFWIHFGAGNLFRAFHACAVQRMLNEGSLDRGIIVAEGFDYEIIEKVYAPHDNLGIAVTLKADGTIDKTVTASVAQAIPLDSRNAEAFSRLKEIFQKDSLQMATFTITEKGYVLVNGTGAPLPDVAADFEAGPEQPESYMGKVASLLYARYAAGKKPLAMVSTDNCSHNGDRLYEAIRAFAEAWTKNGRAEAGFTQYIDSEKVSFPWTMIDKITPRPDASVEAILKKDGIRDLHPIITARNTYMAPFVNAEETEYLVIEDNFPNGRPRLSKGGLLFTDRNTVDKTEKMKVCTCLNPLHTCLAIFGCLLGYHKISEEMKDPDLYALTKAVGYDEGLPVVINPGILDPKEFLRTVLEVRLPNPFMPDTPQRIATDTSQKLAVRFGETIRAYAESDTKSTGELTFIPLVLAGWLRYLMGVDDYGAEFELSPDPLLKELRPHVAPVKWGETHVEKFIGSILENEQIFGVDLYKTGLAQRISDDFRKLIQAPGSVRKTLQKYTAGKKGDIK